MSGPAGRSALVLAAAISLLGPAAQAQPAASFGGYASLLLDAVPSAPGRVGEDDGAREARARVFLESRATIGTRVTLRASGEVEGLAASRFGRSRRAATVQPRELTVTVSARMLEISAGVGQVVWGRLDEFQPTDVVNPIDITRFFLEGRAEARRAVGLARARLFLPGGATLDGVLVPRFRAASFDLVDAGSSPFSLEPREVCLTVSACLPVEVRRRTPAASLDTLQGGGRLTATTGRVDWAVMAWRGFETVPLYAATPLATALPFAPAVPVDAVHPRTTVLGADAETVRGPWGLRAEAAWHVDDTLQATDRSAVLPARSIEAGLGVDRRAGDYRVSFTVLGTSRRLRDGATGLVDTGDVQLVTAIDRSFVRDTRRLRVFGVVNPADASAFVRGVAAWSLRDGLWLEASGGWLTGSATDTLSRLAQRDFLYLRCRVYF